MAAPPPALRGAEDSAITLEVLKALDDHHRQAEKWLQMHNEQVRGHLERLCQEQIAKEATRSVATVTFALASPPRSGDDLDHKSATFKDVHAGQNWDDNCSETASRAPPSRAGSVDSTAGHKPQLQTSQSKLFKSKSRSNSRFMTSLMSGNPATETFRQHLSRVMQNNFDIFIGCLVLVNTLMTFVQLEVEVPSPETAEPPEARPFFTVLTHIFNAIFILELVARMFLKQCEFFFSFYNWLDLGIVLSTSLDAYVLSQLTQSRQNISFIRMVRFMRLVRALQVIRTMELFRQLRVLLNTITMSFMSLFWSMTIVFIFMLMFSLLLCQMLQPYIMDVESDIELRRWVARYYGSSGRSLWTIFEVTFSGGWPTYARPLVEEVAWYYALFFAFYVTGVVFAMIRIISALFLKDTLQTAANDADMMVSEKQKEMKAVGNKLAELFQQADESGDGFLSREELAKIMSYPKVRLWMSVFGLDVTETSALFDILDDGDGLVSYEEFVGGIMRLKGTSRSQDTIAIMRDMQRIIKLSEQNRIACDALFRALTGDEGEHQVVPSSRIGAMSSLRKTTSCRDGGAFEIRRSQRN